eukprot:CAMPEP_0174325916 /NCGR_PEP_ID=MMETSP0810-20121108/13569_1 /TAXON_ID=73025 ORGANISM="Eutreptiella gymnastica-like, Strain CCMP1594" /NCGR_SAMPLE_ID=MMETSP0810 /ASSEMBLY_ACC=CAM_ASM_000659 /LENGTH=69 /DNA_ID=CAMNT_0015439389 /DNA_START=1841 /DNA_END=2050 /DNA_ORIENTATION=+
MTSYMCSSSRGAARCTTAFRCGSERYLVPPHNSAVCIEPYKSCATRAPAPVEVHRDRSPKLEVLTSDWD